RPGARIVGLGRQILRVTLLRAVGYPVEDHLFVGVCEPPVVAEDTVWPFGSPRRHLAARDGVFDFFGLAFRAVVVAGGEGCESAGMMAGRAVLVENRRHVLREGRRCLLWSDREPRKASCGERRDRQSAYTQRLQISASHGRPPQERAHFRPRFWFV